MIPVNETYSYTDHNLKTASSSLLSKIAGWIGQCDGSSQENVLLYGAWPKNSSPTPLIRIDG